MNLSSEVDERDTAGIKIGELIKQTGVTRATIHHYVREGLLPEPTKTSRNMALYDPTCIDRVLLIKELQTKTRRSLAEVKTLLEEASGHTGISRLQNMVESEALRAQSSPLHPERSQGPLSVTQIIERTGFSRKDLDEFDTLGLVNSYRKGGRRLFGPADIDVADALSRLAEAGFDADHGFKPSHAVIYLDALRSLLHKEVALFLETTSNTEDPENLVQMAELGIERVTPLLLALRRKLMHEFIEAAPLPPKKHS